MGELLETRFGAIDVTVQDGRTAYVRVGTGDRDDATMVGGSTVLELPRGVALLGRAHFKRANGSWTPMRGFSSLYRVGSGDPTPKQLETAHAAIVEALDAVTDEQLDDAQYAKNIAEAEQRRAQAAALTRMVDQLNRQATELEMDRGSRVVYLEQRMRSGIAQEAIAVRTSSGELLFVDEPRGGESVNANGLRRYLGEPAPWTERD